MLSPYLFSILVPTALSLVIPSTLPSTTPDTDTNQLPLDNLLTSPNILLNPTFQSTDGANSSATLSLPSWSTTGIFSLRPLFPQSLGNAATLSTGFSSPLASISQSIPAISPGRSYILSWQASRACTSMADLDAEVEECSFTVSIGKVRRVWEEESGHEEVGEREERVRFVADGTEGDVRFTTGMEGKPGGGSTWVVRDVRLVEEV
ncbi:hypothetical protein K461DRAFT_57271 [Myriangium duriaei CBS 260.36]|uniref:CBM-cenC domain-containing protein n=1 Tax=Myriangium duriaei CBS 260.36 TaxID=1168546 RepID=A0A9P4MDP3_9PEZI|nr:hypothetical protein K461DRAFT_57271 [Myriangium duriaei CBS 260.36]